MGVIIIRSLGRRLDSKIDVSASILKLEARGGRECGINLNMIICDQLTVA